MSELLDLIRFERTRLRVREYGDTTYRVLFGDKLGFTVFVVAVLFD